MGCVRRDDRPGLESGARHGKSGIDVRYKYYAYRWNASYAKQMHHKYFVIDKKILFTGSYNLSHSGERNAENVLEIRDAELAERLARWIDEVRGRYEPAPLPQADA